MLRHEKQNKKIICEFCDKIFKFKSKLLEHQKHCALRRTMKKSRKLKQVKTEIEKAMITKDKRILEIT